MLSFDEDGLDGSAPYGPQHSTPVKSKFGNSNSSLASNPKSKLTLSQSKASERKEFRDSFTSPSNPADMGKSVELSSRRQSAHMARHFIPDGGVDISQIPPSEGSYAHRTHSANQCEQCLYPIDNDMAFGAKNRSQAFRNSSSHRALSEGDAKFKSCASESPENQSQYTLEPNCGCRLPSSSSHRQSRMSSPSRRSDMCCFRSISRQNNQGLYHRSSEASLSGLTSDCCSPKQTKSSAYSIHSLARSSVSARPGCRSPSNICRSGCSGQKFRSHSLPRTGYSGVNICNHSTGLEGSGLSMADISKRNPAILLDNDIISKQREEIQLLMEELAGRDQELNDLVTSHQKQVRVWEADRDKLDSLQARLTKYEEELSNKEQQLKETLEEMGRAKVQKELDLSELGKTQADMVKLAERISENSSYIHEIELQNKSLGTTVKELLADKKRLEERERELMQQMDGKNAESIEQKAVMKKMKEKIDCLENEIEITEEKCRRKVQENEAWRTKFFMEKDEAEKLAADCDSKDLTMAKMTTQLQESLQQAVALQKALFTSCEREKCKEEVLHSLRKQHKRTMQELSNIRELYDIQNRDLTTQNNAGKDSGTARCSVSAKGDNFFDRLGSMKEMRAAGKKRRETHGEREASRSVSNELSESRTDAQFDGDDLLNTCQSRLTNVLTSPKSELQEYASDQHFTDNQAPGQSHLKPAGLEMPGNAGQHSGAQEMLVKPTSSRLEPGSDAPVQSQSHPHARCHSQTQEQSLSRSLQQLPQPRLHLHPEPHPQPQPASDLSHYSTASAASVKGKNTPTQRDLENSNQADRQEKSQPAKCQPTQLFYEQRVSRSHPPEQPLPQDRRKPWAESERESHQKEHHHRHQYQREETASTKSSSPKRGSNAAEKRYRDHSGGSSPGKRSFTQTRASSPSHSPSKGRKVENIFAACEQGIRNNHDHAELKTKMADYSFDDVQATQHKQKAHGESQRTRKFHEEHNSIRSKESLGSLISKHADSSDSPVQHIVNKLTSKQAEAPTPCESPRKTHRPRGKEGRDYLDELEKDYGVPESWERKASVARQDSYVITQQTHSAAEAKSCADEPWSRKSKLSRHSLREERQSDCSPDKSSNRSLEIGRASTLVREETKKDQVNGGRSTPGFCPSMSDVSNLPSPVKFDDELTPADSDGMCRELKRDLKKMGRARSPGAKVSYRKYSAALKRESGNKREQVNNEDEERSVCGTRHLQLESSGELRKSCSSRESKALRSDVSQAEVESRKNSSTHKASSFERSPDSVKRTVEKSHHQKAATQKEQDRKPDPISPAGGQERSTESEKILRSKKKKSRSSEVLDDELSAKERTLETSSRHNVPATGECGKEETLEGSEGKQCQKEKVRSKDRSLEKKDLPARWEKYIEETHHGNDSRAERQVKLQDEDLCNHPCVSPKPYETSKKYAMADTLISTSNKTPVHGVADTPTITSTKASLYAMTETAINTSNKASLYAMADTPIITGNKTSMYAMADTAISTGNKPSSYAMADTPISTSTKPSSYYYNTSQYASPDLSRDPCYTSRHSHSSVASKHSVGLGLGASLTRPSPSKRSSALGASPKAGSGIVSSSKNYASRRFFPPAVGAYLSHRLSSWYPGSSSGSYALNNNNENDSPIDSTDGRDDGADVNDDNCTDASRCSDDRYSDGRHLNKNNNEGCRATDDNPADSEIHYISNNDGAADNNNNNNVNPININDISLQEIICADSQDTSEAKDRLSEDLDATVHSPGMANSISDLRLSLPLVHSAENHSSHTVDSSEDHFSELLSCQDNDLVSSKPFAIRGQTSLYRQLAQIHFSEKTRRYEWVVIPPHLEDVHQNVEPPRSQRSERASAYSCTASDQTSDVEPEPESMSNQERRDSKSSEDSSCRSVSTSSFGTGSCHINGSSRSKGVTIATGHSDSGLYSLNSNEGIHAGAYSKQNIQPLTDRTQSFSSLGGCVTVSQTFTTCTSSSSVASNKSVTTTVTRTCYGNGSISSASPSKDMVDSFMGVTPLHQETPPQRVRHQDDVNEDQADKQRNGKHPYLSCSLDEVVKRLDFEDTTLDGSTVGILDTQEMSIADENQSMNKPELGGRKQEGDTVSAQGHQRGISSKEMSVTEEKCLVIVKAAKRVPLFTDRTSRERGDMLAATLENEKNCVAADTSNQASLSQYFQDISTLSVGPDSVMSHNEEEEEDTPGCKYVASFNGIVEERQCNHASDEVLKQAQTGTESKPSETSSQQIHWAFNPQTKRYVTLQRLDNGIYQEVSCYGQDDAPCPKNLNTGKFFSSADVKSSWHQHPDSGVIDETDYVSQHQESPRQQKVWIYEDSVEEVAEHFDDRLSSFLEEKDLIETTQKILQGSPPLMSPASKLHRLLLESQHLIWALERSSAVPEALRSGLSHY